MAEYRQEQDREDMNKSKFDKSRLLTYMTFLLVTAVTIVLSLYNVGFDPTKIVWAKFASDLCINYAVTIALMFVAGKDGIVHYHTSSRHPYSKNLDFLANRAWSVIKRGLAFAFTGFAHQRYLDNKEDYLRYKLQKVGLQRVEILDLTFKDIETLLTTPLLINKGTPKEIGFDTLTKEQYVVVYDLKNGKYQYDEIPSAWFLNGFTSSAADQYQFYSHIQEVRKKAKGEHLAYRLIMLGLVSAMWSMAFMGQDVPTAQSIINAIVRTGTALTAIVSGYMGAKDEVDSESDELAYKYGFIDLFFSDYNSGIFVPKNLTDIVIAKLKVLEEQAKADEASDGVEEPSSTS